MPLQTMPAERPIHRVLEFNPEEPAVAELSANQIAKDKVSGEYIFSQEGQSDEQKELTTMEMRGHDDAAREAI